MSFFEKLKKKLRGKIPENFLDLLPRSYNLLGKVVVLKLRKELEPYEEEIGKAVLDILPVKTVCRIEEIKGEKRKPKIKVIVGNGTETVHKEHGCLYKMDVSKVMFSKGNKYEKLVLVKKVKKGEIVLDMFAGIGYFTIPIAKHTQAKRIIAIDINDDALKYLKANTKLNKVEDKVWIIKGDSKYVVKALGRKIKFDRILMGYFYDRKDFLTSAFHASKSGTVIHYHFLGKKEEVEKEVEKVKEISESFGFSIEIDEIRKVKSYAPRVYHFVLDIVLK